MKQKKGKIKKLTFSFNKLTFGTFGLKCIKSGTLKFSHKIIIKQFILKKTKNNKIKFWLNFPTFYNCTKKGIAIRMGKGSGKIINNICKITAGITILEICGFNKKLLLLILKNIKKKIPLKTKILKKKNNSL